MIGHIEQPEECEACGNGYAIPEADIIQDDTTTLEILHEKNCIREWSKDGSCLCKTFTPPLPKRVTKDKVKLTQLNFHGRKLWLCEECLIKEQAILKSSEKQLHEYQKNIPDRLEDKVQAEIKRTCTVAKWQELYSTEREQWVLSNFESTEDMRNKLTEFIISMEKLEWEYKTKKRAAFDSAKELDARLSKEEREALINDPNFKVPTNSEFKKIQEERQLDETIKTMGANHLDARQRKAVAGLLKFGLSPEEIKEQLKIK